MTSETIVELFHQGVSEAAIARRARVTVEAVEYILDRAWNNWAEAYGYDN